MNSNECDRNQCNECNQDFCEHKCHFDRVQCKEPASFQDKDEHTTIFCVLDKDHDGYHSYINHSGDGY